MVFVAGVWDKDADVKPGGGEKPEHRTLNVQLPTSNGEGGALELGDYQRTKIMITITRKRRRKI